MCRVSKKANPSLVSRAKACGRSASALTAIFLMASLAGCASYSKDHFTVGSVPSDYRSKHPIVVGQHQISEDLAVNPNMREMSLRQRNVVNSFLTQFRNAGAGSITVMLPAGSRNEAAARRVGRDILTFMKNERIPRNAIRVSRYHASNHGDAATIRLSYTALDAKVHGKCGQWTEDLTETHDNKNYHNFGCATQNNLAEMIANPEDLLNPRGQSEIDAQRRDNVINNWREQGTGDLPAIL